MCNQMTSAEENRQRNRLREGEESECLSVFYVCLSVCTHNGQRRLGEEGYIGQIQRLRKHMQRGLTRSYKLLSSPIDFFSTTSVIAKKTTTVSMHEIDIWH